VDSRFLMVLFDSVYLIAMTSWVGSILFFSFGVAPVIFKVLGAEAGGKFVRALFPRYYLWGAVAGAIALPAMVGVPLCFPELRRPMVGVLATINIVGVLIMLYAGNSLTPAINAARDAGPARQQEFDRLHRLSVRLNGLVLVLGLGLLVAFAARRMPQTGGIIEPTLQERARMEDAYLRSRANPAKTKESTSPRP
jgi:uncharacterized membrane protein